ncbi:MAG: T9SS type A sorting domain-containing protein [Candidatus Latescibacterota bacterium]|nr:MAG: T9SS type A sorting domain-containing protein [Candidatus Latescibacterota bacterium]
MNFNLTSGDHVSVGEPVSPLVTQSSGSPIGPPAMYVYGGCPLVDNFDVLQPVGSAFRAVAYTDPSKSAVIAQATPNAAGTTARFVLSGFEFASIRDDQTVPPQTTIDRAEHLRDILIWFQNLMGDPVGIDALACENRLENNYPNPFNPVTTIKYSIAERGHVSLKIYNVAGQLVRALVDEVQSPDQAGFSSRWNGMNDQGQPVSSGVYFYRLTAGNRTLTKKMVLLK